MGRDSRWGFIPFAILRPAQLLLSIIVLGLTGFLVSEIPVWWACIGLFIGIVAFIWGIVSIALFFSNILLPLVVVILDAFCVFFMLIAFAGAASSGFLAVDCTFSSYSFDGFGDEFFSSGTNKFCLVTKGAFAIEFLAFLVLVASLVIGALTLHRTRKDLRGKKHGQGLGDEDHDEEVVQHTAVPMQPVGAEHGYYQTEEPKTDQFVQQQPMQPTYYPEQPPQGYISSPSSPPPQMMVQPSHNTVSSVSYNNMSPSPSPRPIHEVPTTRTPAPGVGGPELQG